MSVKVIGKHEKDSRACRDALALTLNEMMAEDKSIVYVDCDLMGCINTKMLRKNYPDHRKMSGNFTVRQFPHGFFSQKNTAANGFKLFGDGL